jgi:putative membrane protein
MTDDNHTYSTHQSRPCETILYYQACRKQQTTIMPLTSASSLIVTLLLVSACGAFQFHHDHVRFLDRSGTGRHQGTLLHYQKPRPGSMEAATVELGRVPYGEASRKYRRTEYTHADWVLHRSEDRLVYNLKGLFFSGVVRQLKKEIGLITTVAALVVGWNDVLVPVMPMIPHLNLPMTPFTLSSPALGLLLVFRTNASYQRWLEGRNRWGVIIAQSRNMLRMASTFADTSSKEGRNAIDDLSQIVWILSRTIMNRLSGPDDDSDYEKELREVCKDNDSLILRLLSAPDRASAALMEASIVLNDIPVDEKRRVEIDKSLVLIGDAMSATDRIFTSPVPLVYTRHTARFLSVWMLLLPFAIHAEFLKADASGLPTIPASAALALFLFGIEELAVQLEEPFSILPMQSYCDEIREIGNRMIDWNVQSRKERAKESAPNGI